MSTVEFRSVTFSYPGAGPDSPSALIGIDLKVLEGEVLLVVGDSGSGKSSLLRCVNGLAPHSTGGTFGGEVIVGGRSTRNHLPRDLADIVGFVHQDPEAQFVVDRVEHDVAFALENLGLDEASMRRRVEEVLDALGIAHLRDRSPATLSGGERQRCAIAGALALAPSVLVLDEPTSQLDPQGADDVLAALSRLNADLGTTVLLAEHRLERAAPIADRAIVMSRGDITDGPDTTAAVIGRYPGAPSVTRLGRALGWPELPLTVRDARATATRLGVDLKAPLDQRHARGETLLSAKDLRVDIARRRVLHGVSMEIAAGDVIALLGRNGSGKTTLLRALSNLVSATSGEIVGSASIAYVPQDPGTLLFAPTVRDELAETLRLLGKPRDEGAIDCWIESLGLREVEHRHPRGLSGGERQRVAIAAVAIGGAQILLLDEPTRGMDAASRAALELAVRSHAERGGAVVLATHDVELAARCATRVTVLGDGEIVAEGDARQVLSGSLFAPQVLRVLPPFLTVEEVEMVIAE